MKKIISLIIAAVMMISFGVTAFAQTNETNINGSNWMSALNGEELVTAINMPGTHDSASKNALPFNVVTSTQNKTIIEQLYAGVRYLDIRLELTKRDEINVVHGISQCKASMGLTSKTLKADDITNICIDFLKKNPGEAIFLHIREDAGDAAEVLFNKFYTKCIMGNEGYWYIRNDVPCLNDVRGKIVLLRGVEADRFGYDDTNSGINFTTYPYISSTELNNFAFRPVSKFETGSTHAYMYVQDSYKLTANDKIETVKTFLETYKLNRDFNICATNCIGSGTPHYCAEKVNKWFMSYTLTKGTTYGIISMDFITDELCEKIYSTNNFVSEPNAATVNTEETKYSLFGRPLALMRNLIQRVESIFA